ncbi:FAD-binding oxidoreductase [Streptomyces sp. NPDC087420]|uniref:FAD-binding oxidoreductase n=1 Tax=Streptomyces sp. NPDC087420 TaxID=3365785 RepID=UPI00383579A7
MTQRAEPTGPVPSGEATALASVVAGRVFLPGDDGYAVATGLYNLNLVLEPALVVAAANAADVQATVRFAARHGRPVAVKTTGHQTALPARGAVLITMEAMTDVVIDPDARTARVGAGVIWQSVIDRACTAGLAPVNGSMPRVGVAGYTLGGGQSPFLGRTRGYAADHVRSLDVVTADGELRHVDPTSDPELFWALRGGKGNFGIVTALEFDLFPLARLYAGGIYFAGEHMADVLRAWRTWIADIPEEMSSSLAVQRLPPLPELPEPLRGAFVLHLRIAYLGSAADGERLIAPLRSAAPVLLDTVADMPYSAIASVHMDPPEPMPYFDRTTMLREFPPAAADKLVELVGPDSDCPLANVEIRGLGGAFDQQPAVPNAVATRGLPFVMFAFGVGPPDLADQLRGRLAEVVDGMAPWADKRQMVNFLSADEGRTPEELSEVYGADAYRRLVAAKSSYDPTNMFRMNHNITPARGAAPGTES